MSASRIPLSPPEHVRQGSVTKMSDLPKSMQVDVRGLQAELEKNVEGEVRFDAGSKAMYAVDASNYRQVPIGVVVPKSKEDAVATVAACRKFGAALLSRG